MNTATTTEDQVEQTVPETATLAADIVLLGLRDNHLHVLLIQRLWEPYEGCWALPGGLVDAGEEIVVAAHRELGEETGFKAARLHQFAAYSEPGRDPRGRVVSFVFIARVNGTPEPAAGDDAAAARWVRCEDIRTGAVPLAFDHKQIVNDAILFAFDPSITDHPVNLVRIR
jgi:8-oxo-dGTP diphosphatase